MRDFFRSDEIDFNSNFSAVNEPRECSAITKNNASSSANRNALHSILSSIAAVGEIGKSKISAVCF